MRKILPGIITILYFAYLQSHITLLDGDAFFFLTRSDEMGFIPFLITRYNTWSSRLIIEGALVIMAHAPGLWFIFNLLIIMSIWYCLMRILSVRFRSEQAGWIALFLTALYPFSNLSSAGWIATTMNYLWPLAALVFIVYQGFIRAGLDVELFAQDKKSLDDGHAQPRILAAVISLLAAVYVANLEQGAVLLCVVSICFIIVALKSRMSMRLYVAWFIVGALGIVFALTCPGNAARAAVETLNWWPTFDQLSIITKIAYGLEATTDRYLFGGCSLLFILTVALVVTVWNERGFGGGGIPFLP